MKYGIYVYCDECSKDHTMGIIVYLFDGPANRQSIGDFYKGNHLPQVMAHIVQKRVLCTKTGKFFIQQDSTKIFLVPEGN